MKESIVVMIVYQHDYWNISMEEHSAREDRGGYYRSNKICMLASMYFDFDKWET